MNDQATLQSLVDELSGAIGRPVVLDDPGLVPLAYSRQWGDLDPVRRSSILGRSAPDDVRRALFAQGISTAQPWLRTDADADLGMEGRVCIPIRTAGEVAGYLWVLDPDASLDEGAMRCAMAAADDIAGALGAGEAKDERALLDGLCSPEPDRRQPAVGEVLRRRLLPDAPAVLCLAVAGRRADPSVALRAAARRLSVGHAMTGGDSSRAVIVASLDEPLVRDGAADSVAAFVHAAAGGDVCVGQSAPAALGELHRAHHQAAVALRVAAAAPAGSRVAAWPSLGASRLVAQLGDDVVGDVPAALRRMIREDPVLTHTLEVFLDAAGDIKVAADQLSLHRSGLYYRLSRIEELTGVDLHSGDDRLLAHVAIRLERFTRSSDGD